jgi:hypothetical protein
LPIFLLNIKFVAGYKTGNGGDWGEDLQRRNSEDGSEDWQRRKPGVLNEIQFNYGSAMHSTEIKMPAGKGMTCGVLLAGAFSGKNSP